MTMTIFVLSVVASVLATELTGFFPAIARLLLRWHVERLPEGLRERASEEWSADLAAIPGSIFKLLFAIDLFRAVNGMVWAAARDSARVPQSIHITNEFLVAGDDLREHKIASLERSLRTFARMRPAMLQYQLPLADYMSAVVHGGETSDEFAEAWRRLDDVTRDKVIKALVQRRQMKNGRNG